MVAGDDLFCISAFRISLYLVEIGLSKPRDFVSFLNCLPMSEEINSLASLLLL